MTSVRRRVSLRITRPGCRTSTGSASGWRVRWRWRSACYRREGTWRDCRPAAAAAWWPGWGPSPCLRKSSGWPEAWVWSTCLRRRRHLVSYDVVVVGSGPGGAVTARECARRGLKVLVLEEGDRIEPGDVQPFSLTQMRRMYRDNGLTVALGRPSIAYAEARCVGGGSRSDAGLYHRPDPSVLAEWTDRFDVEALHSGEPRAVARGRGTATGGGARVASVAAGVRGVAPGRRAARLGRPRRASMGRHRRERPTDPEHDATHLPRRRVEGGL